MEIAGLNQEKAELMSRLHEETASVKSVRNKLWKEQNLRNAREGEVALLKGRLREIRELMETHLDVFLQHPDLLTALKSKVNFAFCFFFVCF
jgi:hypothetical protein